MAEEFRKITRIEWTAGTGGFLAGVAGVVQIENGSLNIVTNTPKSHTEIKAPTEDHKLPSTNELEADMLLLGGLGAFVFVAATSGVRYLLHKRRISRKSTS